MDYILIKLPLQVIYRHNAVPNVYAHTCNTQGMYMYMCTCTCCRNSSPYVVVAHVTSLCK